jgi:hypothetical protein
MWDIWGIDSVGKANRPVLGDRAHALLPGPPPPPPAPGQRPAHHGRHVSDQPVYDQLLVEYVNSHRGERPAIVPRFWGRYLAHGGHGGGDLDLDEVNYLVDRGCRVLPIFAHFRGNWETQGANAERGGRDAAEAAAHSAGLIFPRRVRRVRIYADLEGDPWYSPEFIKGWHDGLNGQGFLAGVYGNVARGHGWALRMVRDPNRPPAWAIDLKIYSNLPRRGANRAHPNLNWTPADLMRLPEGNPDSRGLIATVWQYLLGAPLHHWNPGDAVQGVQFGIVDADVATRAGFDDMYG